MKVIDTFTIVGRGLIVLIHGPVKELPKIGDRLVVTRDGDYIGTATIVGAEYARSCWTWDQPQDVGLILRDVKVERGDELL